MSKYRPPDLPRSVIESLIEEWVRGKRKRELLKRVYFDESTIETLAEEYDIAESTVKRNLDDAHNQLCKHLYSGKISENELNITDN